MREEKDTRRENISETDIISSFRDSLFCNSIDVLKEYGEIAIDAVLGQGLLSIMKQYIL